MNVGDHWILYFFEMMKGPFVPLSLEEFFICPGNCKTRYFLLLRTELDQIAVHKDNLAQSSNLNAGGNSGIPKPNHVKKKRFMHFPIH